MLAQGVAAHHIGPEYKSVCPGSSFAPLPSGSRREPLCTYQLVSLDALPPRAPERRVIRTMHTRDLTVGAGTKNTKKDEREDTDQRGRYWRPR
jgi:hypothetical protein